MDWLFTPEFHRWPARPRLTGRQAAGGPDDPSEAQLQIQLRLKDFKACESRTV
jgi:hypothetical protein